MGLDNRRRGSGRLAAPCLQELLDHHIEKEERDFFKTARKLFDRAVLEKMGKAFAAEKSKLDVAAHLAAAE